MIRKVFVFIFMIALCAANIYANDSAGIILPAGDIQLTKIDGIKMELESLLIAGKKIEVNYIFENITDEDIATTVFFPLPDVEYYIHNRPNNPMGILLDYDSFSDFKVWIDGKEKKYSLIDTKSVFADDSSSDIVLTKKSFYWEQAFPAKKRVHVKHTYIPRTYDVIYEYYDEDKLDAKKDLFAYHYPYRRGYVYFAAKGEYILKTANNWNKPIRNFNLFLQEGSMKFENIVYFSTNGYVAKNIKNFSPDYDLEFDFFKGIVGYIDNTAQNIRHFPERDYSNVKLYMIDGPAKVRDNPKGKEIAELDHGVYAWVISKKGDWYEIAYNDLTGWTHKQNLIDPWDVEKFNAGIEESKKLKEKK